MVHPTLLNKRAPAPRLGQCHFCTISFYHSVQVLPFLLPRAKSRQFYQSHCRQHRHPPCRNHFGGFHRCVALIDTQDTSNAAVMRLSTSRLDERDFDSLPPALRRKVSDSRINAPFRSLQSSISCDLHVLVQSMRDGKRGTNLYWQL